MQEYDVSDGHTNLPNIDPDVNTDIFASDTCQYCTIDEYMSIPDTYNLTILNYNIRSFHKNAPNFESFLSSLKQYPQFLTLSETWNTACTVNLCSIGGYKSVHTVRESHGGGVSVLCTEDFQINKIDTLSLCNVNIEVCAANICKSNFSLIVLGIYRPPQGSVNIFINELESILSNPVLRNKLVIISGDININIANQDDRITSEYLAMLHSYQFLSTITVPTRFQPNNTNINPSILDHIAINMPLSFSSHVIFFDQTDHLPAVLKFYDGKLDNNPAKKQIRFRLVTEDNLAKFKNYLDQLDWNSLLTHSDVNYDTEKFLQELNKGYCKFFPLNTKFLSPKRLSKPWVTSKLLRLIKTKSNYFKMLKSGDVSQEENSAVRNRVNYETEKAKNEYIQHKFSVLRNDLKKSWKLLSNLSGFSKPKNAISELLVNNITYNSDQSISEIFNEYFSTIAAQLDAKLPSSDIDPLDYLNSADTLCSLNLYAVGIPEINKIVSNLKNTHSGINEVPVKIFKNIFSCISHVLKNLINRSFKTGIFPNCLKIARITPVHKKGPKNLVSNYRPISSLPFLSKVFERCMADRLSNFLHQTNTISKNQFGFQKGISTCDALLKFVNDIYHSLNIRYHHISVMIDLAKAFETVHHKILLRKMNSYGITNVPLKLFENYLSNRKSYVRIGDCSSSMQAINIGVPQGSIIGPILFLIYINDIPNASEILRPIIFADDTTLSTSSNDQIFFEENLNNELCKVQNWCTANRLSINASKTEILLFSNRSFDISQLNIMLDNEILEFTSCCTLFGVKIDDDLNFKLHIQNITGKI